MLDKLPENFKTNVLRFSLLVGLTTSVGYICRDEIKNWFKTPEEKVEEKNEIINKILILNSLITDKQGLQDSLNHCSESEIQELVNFSASLPFGHEHRIHSVVVKNILDIFTVEKIKLWAVDARRYFVLLNFVSPQEVNLENSDMIHDDLYSQARFGNIEATELIIDNKKVKENAQKMLVIGINEGEISFFKEKIERYDYKLSQTEYGLRYTSKNDNKRFIDVILLSNIEKLSKNQYGIIQCKGHTGDMSNFISHIKNNTVENATILILGGCNSDNYVADALRLKTIPIANKSIGESTHNDYLSLQLHSLLKNNTLPEALKILESQAPSTMKKFTTPQDDFIKKMNTLIRRDNI